MHNNENFFKNHKLLILLFIIFFIFFIASTFYGITGIYFDIPGQFFATTQGIFNENPQQWYFLTDERSRLYSNILLTVPYNLSLLFDHKDVITHISCFCASYHITNFIGLICNYLVATRTKRYDVAVIATFFYCFFIIPSAIWATREVHIASMLQFCLLSYFVTKEQFKKIDLLLILILSLYLFESFETSILIGLILFLASLFYMRKKSAINIKEKSLIGLFGLLSALYIPVQTYLYSFNSNNGFQIDVSLQQWINSIKVIGNHSLKSSLLITYLGLIGTAIILFSKRTLKNNIFRILALVLIILLILYFATGFIPSPSIELHSYILSVLLICPIFICIIAMDYFNIDLNIKHKNFYSTLLVLSCIIGILNFSWQINSSLHSKEYVKKIKSIITTSNKPFKFIKEKDISRQFSLYENCFGIVQRSIILSPTYKVKTLLFIDENSMRHQYCFDDKDKTYYDKNNNSFVLQTTHFKTKNRYWDLTDLITEFEKQDRIK